MNKIFLTLFLIINSVLFCQTSNLDTLIIDKPTIVFFTLNKAEYEKQSKNDNSGIDEVLSDFYYYKNKISSFIHENNLIDTLTSRPVIKIKNIDGELYIFERNKLDHAVGIILTDCVNEPILKLGVFTDFVYKELINEYCK